MDSRTITLIASIAVIGLVAVGVGYAYTAMTVNDGNNAQAKYVTLTQDSYTFSSSNSEYFDSISAYYGETPAQHIGYKISTANGSYNASVVTDATSGTGASAKHYTFILLGTVTISASSNGYAANALPTLNLGVDDSSTFTGGTKLTYFLVNGTTVVGKLVNDNNTWTWKDPAGSAAMSISVSATQNATTYADTTLKLCYGYCNDDLETGNTIAGYVEEAPQNLADKKIVFKATITDSA